LASPAPFDGSRSLVEPSFAIMIHRLFCNSIALAGLVCFLGQRAAAQQPLTWEQIQQKFDAANPTLRAGQLNIDEAKANEITAFLRPNPGLSVSLDQFDPFTPNPYRPVTNLQPGIAASYLYERMHKRDLRKESAEKATGIAQSTQEDLRRTLTFTLRNAFVQTLQAKAVLALAKENLEYYDKVLEVNRIRFKAGDIAEVDMDRLELQRIQYLSDIQNATVSLRTSKIVLLQMLNDRTPVDQFDIAGPFDFITNIDTLENFRTVALATRPDLRAAIEAVDKAQTDHKLAEANGSTDPTFGVDFGRQLGDPLYVGLSVSIPLRIFDRNQGEKLRTQLDVTRNERLRDASQAQVFSDVDSAYVTLMGSLNLLQPYKASYLARALKVRDTIAFSYQHGAASLLDFLNAQSDYRSIQLNYLNLVGSFLSAASQLNLAVGKEVIH
jgi:cobalt-zinc-cadmium efflux system outer membrane protein